MKEFLIKNLNEMKKLMELSLITGKSMLENGAETYRVEDTMLRICSSRKNIKNVGSFVIPTGIFLTLEYNNEVFSNFRRVKSIKIDLKKISDINDFSRAFVRGNISIEEGMKSIEDINNTESYSKFAKILSGSGAGASFGLLFGGTIKDFVSTFLICIIVIAILQRISQYKLSFFVDNLIGSLLISLLSYLTIFIKIGDNLDTIIIGSIMFLVPGVAITNSIRDTMSGDTMSGLSRGLEAVFSALAIAFGVGIILNLYWKGVI